MTGSVHRPHAAAVAGLHRRSAGRGDGHAAGAALSSPFQVNTFSLHAQLQSTVSLEANGNFVITWQSYPNYLTVYDIYARRYNAAGVDAGTAAGRDGGGSLYAEERWD